MPFNVECSTGNKNTAKSEKKRANYSVSSPHKHPSFKRNNSQKQEEMMDCSGRADCWWIKMWNEEALPSEWNKNGPTTLLRMLKTMISDRSQNQFVFTWFRGATSDRSESFVSVQQPE